MKIVLLFLAALCGLSTAIQYPLSYEYQYTGEIKTGIHELRNQYAGALLKATLKVTVVTPSEAHVQISNAQVGTMNGDVPSSGRAPLPIPSLQPLPDSAALEKPFVLHFTGQREKLEVPSGEMLWISNLRKSIVSLLRVPFVLSSPVESFINRRHNRLESELPTSFTKEEETVLGTCNVIYTLTKAAPRSSMSLMELEEDVQEPSRQGRPSGLPSVSPSSVYRLVRSVDLYDCKDRVVMTKSSHGNLTDAGAGQLRGIQSRSSIGEYLLTGEPTSELSMRIEKAIVEGVVTLNPFGHETKKIMTITNQTLSLVKVTQTPLVPRPTSPLLPETFAFRVMSPFKRGPNSPLWVSFQEKSDEFYPMYPEKDLTGFELTPQLRAQLKEQIKSEIEKIAELVEKPNTIVQSAFGGSSDGSATQKLESVVSRVRALPVDELKEISLELIPVPSNSLSPVQVIKKELIISALRASGSSAALKVLLEMIEGDALTPMEAANVFTTLVPNVGSPAIIPEIIKFVIALPDNAPISLKTAALINLSTLIRRLCINPSVKSYSVPAEMVGEKECTPEQTSHYIHHLQEKVQSVSEKYLKAIYIQALANVGQLSTVETLGEIAEGKQHPNEISLRLLAIQGLSKNHMLNTTYPTAQKILLSIAEEQVELPVIREAAISSLFTLPKNATMWQRMAMSTWREPSRRVASFIYSLIKSVASSKNPHFINQISMARHVLPLAKPSPMSPYYSARLLSGQYSVSEDIASTVEASYFSSRSSIIPQQIALKVLAVLGGMKAPLLHISATTTSLDEPLRALMRQMLPQLPQVHSARFNSAHEEMRKLTEGQQTPPQEESPAFYGHLTLLKHIELFAPITTDSLSQLSDKSKSILAAIVDKIQLGKPLVSLSYFNPIDVTEIFPSEIGLPIITQLSKPTLLYTKSSIHTSPSLSPEFSLIALLASPTITVTGESITKIVLKSESSVKILVPYLNKTLVTGVDSEVSLSLPAKFFVSMDRSKPSLKQIQFGVTPILESKAPIVLSRTLPFTLVRDLLPTKDITEESIKPINVIGSSPRYSTKIPLPKTYTGIDAEIEFEGDIEFPITATTIKEVLLEPIRILKLLAGPTTRRHHMALLYSPQASSTKEITGTISYVIPPSSALRSSRPSPPVIQDLSAMDTFDERLRKLSLSPVPVTSMLSASLNLTGLEAPRKYEFTLIKFMSGPVVLATEKAEFQINLMKSPIPTMPEPSQICVSNVLEFPLLPPSASMSQILDTPLTSSIISKIFSGEKCIESNQVLLLKAFQSVSEERRQHLKNILPSSALSPPLDTTEAIKSSIVYDKINLELRNTKPASPALKNITNHVSDLIHGLVFPLYEHNYVDVSGTPDIVIVDGTRSLVTDRYTIWTHSPSSICLIRDLRVPAILDYVSPLNGYLMKPISVAAGQRKTMMEVPTSDICKIEVASVKTFAGVQYQKKPMRCNRIAVQSQPMDEERFIIITSQTSESPSAEQHIKIVYPKESLTIIIKKDEILRDGVKVPESQPELISRSGKVLAKVHQTPSIKKVELPEKVIIELSQGKEITIKMNRVYRSKLSGLCGKFGPDQIGDLRDASRCLYSAELGEVYDAAWVPSSEIERCEQQSSPSIRQVVRKLRTYQQTCPKTLEEQAKHRKPSRQ